MRESCQIIGTRIENRCSNETKEKKVIMKELKQDSVSMHSMDARIPGISFDILSNERGDDKLKVIRGAEEKCRKKIEESNDGNNENNDENNDKNNEKTDGNNEINENNEKTDENNDNDEIVVERGNQAGDDKDSTEIKNSSHRGSVVPSRARTELLHMAFSTAQGIHDAVRTIKHFI